MPADGHPDGRGDVGDCKVIAGVGAVYLVGRVLYWRAYVASPSSRGLGYLLSILPVFGLALAGLVPAAIRLSAA